MDIKFNNAITKNSLHSSTNGPLSFPNNNSFFSNLAAESQLDDEEDDMLDSMQYPENATKKEAWFELDMSSMGIRSLSKEIRHYSHITALYLNNNRLVELPDELFSELRSLVILDLSNNQLTKLPSSIGQLSYLEKLAVHQNKLVELPVQLGQLFKLKEFQIDGNPITSPPQNILQGGKNAILAYLRDRVPAGPPPPERRFISYQDPHISIPDKDRFRVLTYNVLAESYAAPDRYFYCPSWALDWNYRKQGLLKEILMYDCDIICLQEVEAGQYSEFFLPEMSKAGYSGVLAPKSRARTMEDWSTVDGCAIFYKRSKFSLVEEHLIEFQSITMARHKEFTDDPEAFSRMMTKDNVAVAVILQMKDPDNPNTVSPQKKNWANTATSAPPKYLLVANTHIHWNPDHKDVKLMQVQFLIEQLSALTGAKSKWWKTPMVIAGDFNSSVDSGPYELLSSGKLRPRHSDLEPWGYGVYSTHGMQHNLNISSAYAPIGEPQFTNFTGDFVGILDYIWFSQDSLAVSKVLQPVDEEAVKFSRLPNAYMHSDHISLLSEFFLKRKG